MSHSLFALSIQILFIGSGLLVGSIPRAKKLLRTPALKTTQVRADGRLVRLTGHLLCRSPMRSPIDGTACFCSRIAIVEHREELMKELLDKQRKRSVAATEVDVAPMMFHADSLLEDEAGAIPLRFGQLRLDEVGRERHRVLQEATCPPSLRAAFGCWFDDRRRSGHPPELVVREQILTQDECVTLYGFGVPDPDAPEGEQDCRPLFVAISAEPPMTRWRFCAPFALIGLAVLTLCAGIALLITEL